jgi:hypothetical protein
MPSDVTSNNPPSSNRSRLGLHYYPDTLHYRESDLQAWLPELKAMGAVWLTLLAPSDRAIPEPFLRGLIQAGIEPILHFHLPLTHAYQEGTLGLLFNVYASWGVHYTVLFDRPNQRSSWPASAWAQSDLVERFLDIFLPVACEAQQAGLVPVFPPLEPGGDYWDTSFLQAALQGIQRRQAQLCESLHLSAYAWADEHPLDWGAGGPECWPGVRPYLTPAGQQDQRGFHIFDWYLAYSQAALGTPRPILLLAAGNRLRSASQATATEEEELQHAATNLAIARSMLDSTPTGEDAESNAAPSPDVLACCFWLLAADPADPLAYQAWFQPGEYTLPVVAALRQLAGQGSEPSQETPPSQPEKEANIEPANPQETLPPQPEEDASPEPSIPPETPPPPTEEEEAGSKPSNLQETSQAAVPEAEPVQDNVTPDEPDEAPAYLPPLPFEQPSEPVLPSFEDVLMDIPVPPPAPTIPAFSPAGLYGELTKDDDHPIAHYLLLPLYEVGAAEWHLDAARPFILKYHPTVGYALDEASLAACVTVVGGEPVFPEESLEKLRQAGCIVTRIAGDGTEIATQLASR